MKVTLPKSWWRERMFPVTKNMEDHYYTIVEGSQGEFRDRGSKFLAYAFPVKSENEWQERLTELKKSHPKANHHCYAYRLGLDQNNFRANDDGEPSGTAGRPILGQIDSFGLTNIIVIVVRYFGGTKLGTSGLINAYKVSTAAALEKASILEKTVEDIYQLTFDYALMSKVMNAVKRLEIEMIEQDFTNVGRLHIALPQSQTHSILTQLKAHIAQISIEEAEQLEAIDGLEMNYSYTR